MYKVNILVLLYNKKISESTTISGILKSSYLQGDVKLVIWNNGPVVIDVKELDVFQGKLFDVELIETLDNKSLSEVYDDFYNNNEGDVYIILDDDSYVGDEYLGEALKTKPSQVSLPIIYCDGEVTSPIVNGRKYSKDLTTIGSETIFAIGSGLVIGREVAEEVKSLNGDLFDQRFYFYGVDVTFCHRLNDLATKPKIRIISGFNHAQSKMAKESHDVKKFRRKERSFDLGLRLKYYYTSYSSIKIISRVVLSTTLKKITGIGARYNVFDLINAYICGKHYKS